MESVVGSNLRRIRAAEGLSQAKLAAAVGITRPAYRRIEDGTSLPPVEILWALARALEVGIEELVTAAPEPPCWFQPLEAWEQIPFEIRRRLRDLDELEEILGERVEPKLGPLGDRLPPWVATSLFLSSTSEPMYDIRSLDDRLFWLVRRAVEANEITLSRGAEILGLSLIEMRQFSASWTAGWDRTPSD